MWHMKPPGWAGFVPASECSGAAPLPKRCGRWAPGNVFYRHARNRQVQLISLTLAYKIGCLAGGEPVGLAPEPVDLSGVSAFFFVFLLLFFLLHHHYLLGSSSSFSSSSFSSSALGSARVLSGNPGTGP